MNIRFALLVMLLSVNITATAQIYLSGNGLTSSGSGASTKVSLGGTLDDAAMDIDFGSSNSNSNFRLKKGTSNYFYVGNNGKVGIGTASPLEALDVNGAIRATSMALISSDNIFKIGSTNPLGWRIDLSSGGAGDSHFRYGSGSAWSYNFNTGTGHVVRLWDGGIQAGLGNVNGTAALHVRRNSYSSAIARLESSAGVVQFIVLDDGKAGFGTATPQHKIHAAGIGNVEQMIESTNDGNAAITLRSHNKKYEWSKRGSTEGNNLLLNYHDGTSWVPAYITVTPTGNVGVGTITPQAKLAVNGDVFARKIRVTLVGWPDYVFHPGYSLRPLTEVEKFIRENRHLPEVPSAAEVEKNGLDLGEGQAVLLKKIEELTLYVIEQQKELKELKKELVMIKERTRKTEGRR